MKGKVCLERCATFGDHPINRLEAASQLEQVVAGATLRGDTGCLDLHSQSKLQYVLDLGKRAHLLAVDAKGRVGFLIRDEYARALPTDDQPL